ncbi:hypothetical protein FQA39_LY01301 [Lamprigera yunnana]|nr:hypothetical protein FQA39_LY01301 [Lamprigera yunnana]
MSKPFKLSAILSGHSLDVRSITATSKNHIISGSRDKTAKLWIRNESNNTYAESTIYKDQKNFVASVLYLEPTVEFPNGLVITGGNDSVILIYQTHDSYSSLALREHSNTVCHLSRGVEENTFLSSSWDNTAKLWNLKQQHSVSTFSGHTAAVWSVIQLQNLNIVTASADRTIGIFSRKGFRINTIQAHNDCIRDLVDFPDLKYFLSVSNDASIKVWSYSGSNLDTYYGHTNFIYSIARNAASGNNCFVTSDEDRTIRFWEDGINTDMFQLPAQSVWSVTCLSNGDIVTGSSDGMVRIFTQDEDRVASADVLKVFEEDVAALTKQSIQEIGGYKVSDLPGKEALYEPGNKAGQMKMIREAQGVVAYTWVDEGESSHWEKIGDVLGSADPNAGSKTTFEGKPYDFVFTVDVEEGKPPLKLPYNKGDDPYIAAHKFLERNMLPAVYLDQVVNFILTNSADATSAPVNSNFVDPFTGGSRYTPSVSTSTSNNAGIGLDPGSGSFSTSSKQGMDNAQAGSQYFPQKEYRSFDTGDSAIILVKLKEFNKKASDGAVNEDMLVKICNLCNNTPADEQCIDTFINLLNWKDDIAFPILDILRMAARFPDKNRLIFCKHKDKIIDKLKYCISLECKSSSCMLVAFRALCNMFLHPPSEQLIFEYRLDLLENITSLCQMNKNIEIAVTTFLLNLVILTQKLKDEFGILLLSNLITDIILTLNDCESQFRGLVAMGTLLTIGSPEHSNIMKSKIQENSKFINKLKNWSESHFIEAETKRSNCAKQLLLHLKM